MAYAEARVELVAPSGEVVGSVRVRHPPDGCADGQRPFADDVHASAELALVAAAVLDQLAGWSLLADEDLGLALVPGGGQLVRHAHDYRCALTQIVLPDPPELPAGVRLTAVDQPVPALAAARQLAGETTHEEGVRALTSVLGGRFGQLLDASGLAVDDEGGVLAACLVTDLPGIGPFAASAFRRPGAPPGLGRGLMIRALRRLQEQGWPTASLVVSEGNPAHRIYDDLGFARIRSSVLLRIPPVVPDDP